MLKNNCRNQIQGILIGIELQVETPFETPESSPSRLEEKGEEEEESTPPLSPMKKLPQEGASIDYGVMPCSWSSDSQTNSPSW